MQNAKSPIKSKTLWFNILSIAAIILADEHFKEIIGNHAAILFVLQSIVNIGLRFVTTKPVKIQRRDSLDMY